MAAPVTHIVLAQQIHQTFFADKNICDFIVGTSFPDIRHLKVISREASHVSCSLASAQQASSFRAGWEFHCLVDMLYKEFYYHNDFYKKIPDISYKSQALKFLEDIYLWSKVSNWSVVAEYFSELVPEEKTLDIPENKLIHWHMNIQNYCATPVNYESVYRYIIGLGTSESTSQKIIDAINILDKSVDLEQFEKFYQSVPKLLSEKNIE